MATFLTLIAALLLVLLVLVSWHGRALAMREAQRLEAEGARGREIESIAMDAASLLAATLQSIETARVASDADARRRTLDDALGAANALSKLFHVARVYLTPHHDAFVEGTAEGCARVAIAIVRSRGCGISVRGERTGLSLEGGASAACSVLVEVLEACQATLGSGEFVEVVLDEADVRMLPGTARALVVDKSVGLQVGWDIDTSEWEGRAAVTIRSRARQADGDGRGLVAAHRTRGLVH